MDIVGNQKSDIVYVSGSKLAMWWSLALATHWIFVCVVGARCGTGGDNLFICGLILFSGKLRGLADKVLVFSVDFFRDESFLHCR